jgi:hypothetical protein
MPKLCAGPRVFPRRRKTSHLFNERPAVDSDHIALLDVRGAVVHTDVGVDPVTRIDMKTEAASVGGLFRFNHRPLKSAIACSPAFSIRSILPVGPMQRR